MAPLRPRVTRFSETESVAEVAMHMPGVSTHNIDVQCTPTYVKVSGLGDPVRYLLALHLRGRVDTAACSCSVLKGSADVLLKLVKEAPGVWGALEVDREEVGEAELRRRMEESIEEERVAQEKVRTPAPRPRSARVRIGRRACRGATRDPRGAPDAAPAAAGAPAARMRARAAAAAAPRHEDGAGEGGDEQVDREGQTAAAARGAAAAGGARERAAGDPELEQEGGGPRGRRGAGGGPRRGAGGGPRRA